MAELSVPSAGRNVAERQQRRALHELVCAGTAAITLDSPRGARRWALVGLLVTIPSKREGGLVAASTAFRSPELGRFGVSRGRAGQGRFRSRSVTCRH